MLFEQRVVRSAIRTLATLVAAGALAALAACGGGTYQQESFVPARILTFGDESSRLEGPQGLKYSVNGVSSSTGQIDCNADPIWTQSLASSYGQVYANCNIDASFETNAIDLTTVDATVADVVRSVAAFQAGDTFNGNDLVTIWVGMHDVLDDYQSNASADESVLLADMRAQGQTLAGVVNAIAAAGGKVVLLTVPDMSESPFGYAESLRGDFDRLKLLSDMSTAFNLGLRTHIINDGSQVALVTVDDIVRYATRASGSTFIQFDNQSYGCLDTAPLPTCTIDTLRNDPTTGQPTQSFLWADATHLGATLQAQIGGAASQRAHGNPF